MKIKKLVRRVYALQHMLFTLLPIVGLVTFILASEGVSRMGITREPIGSILLYTPFVLAVIFILNTKRITETIITKIMIPKIKAVLPEFKRQYFGDLSRAINEADRLQVEKEQYLDFVRGFYRDRIARKKREIEETISGGRD